MLASVLVFMYGVKNYLLANFWILLGVMLETGIDCAKIAPLTIKVAMSMFFVSVLYKMLFQMIPKLSKYLKGTMLKMLGWKFPSALTALVREYLEAMAVYTCVTIIVDVIGRKY